MPARPVPHDLVRGLSFVLLEKRIQPRTKLVNKKRKSASCSLALWLLDSRILEYQRLLAFVAASSSPFPYRTCIWLWVRLPYFPIYYIARVSSVCLFVCPFSILFWFRLRRIYKTVPPELITHVSCFATNGTPLLGSIYTYNAQE